MTEQGCYSRVVDDRVSRGRFVSGGVSPRTSWTRGCPKAPPIVAPKKQEGSTHARFSRVRWALRPVVKEREGKEAQRTWTLSMSDVVVWTCTKGVLWLA
jgi:hypothetical protein